MKILLIVLCLLIAVSAMAMTYYVVEMSYSSQIFIIAGKTFKAKTACFGIYRGDRVIFVKGNPYSACATAAFMSTRTNELCEVWCE